MSAVSFSFYPRHEHGCPHVGHCPHLGGASLGLVVLAANENEETHDQLYWQLDAARESISDLVAEVESLKKQLAQAKLELKLERQTKFATNRQQHSDSNSPASARSRPAQKRKRGAPLGHPGWYRPPPTAYDLLVEVAAPARCPIAEAR